MAEIKTISELNPGDLVYVIARAWNNQEIALHTRRIKGISEKDYGNYHSEYQKDVRRSFELEALDGSWCGGVTIPVAETITTVFDDWLFTVKEDAIEFISKKIDEEISSIKEKIEFYNDKIQELIKRKELIEKEV